MPRREPEGRSGKGSSGSRKAQLYYVIRDNAKQHSGFHVALHYWFIILALRGPSEGAPTFEPERWGGVPPARPGLAQATKRYHHLSKTKERERLDVVRGARGRE